MTQENSNRSQVIYSVCCNRLVAAACEPYCYTDKDWKRQITKAAKEGCKIDIVSNDEVRKSFSPCDCKKGKRK